MTGYAAATASHGVMRWDLKALRKEILDGLGDISGFEIWGNQVLLAVACEPVETKGRIVLGNDTKIEAVWQGKVGMILRIGPDCFTENAKTFNHRKPKVGDFVYHNVNEQTLQLSLAGPGWKKTQIKAPNGTTEDTRAWNGWPVRLVADRYIYGRVQSPEIVI